MYNVVAILSMADVVCLACMYAETVEFMSSTGSIWCVWIWSVLYVGVYIVKFIDAGHGRYA